MQLVLEETRGKGTALKFFILVASFHTGVRGHSSAQRLET